MSNTVFKINYNKCKAFNREIQSNITFLDEIIQNINSANEYLEISRVGMSVWNTEYPINDNNNIKNKLYIEKDRYEQFHKRFENFYTNVKQVDSQLASYLVSQLTSIEDNSKDYDFLIAGIEVNQNENITDDIYNMLIQSGMSQEEALKICSLLTIEGQNEIIKLSEMTAEDFEKYRQELISKNEKSFLDEIILNVISSFTDYKTYISELSDKLKDGKFNEYIESIILGRSSAQMRNDIRSIEGQIRQYIKKLDTPNLSNKKRNIIYDRLMNDLNHLGSKTLKLKFSDNAINTASKIGKGIVKYMPYIEIAIGTPEIINENSDNYKLYGVDVQNAWYDFGIDMASLITYTFTSAKISSFVGTLFGPEGTVIGFIVGTIVGVAGGLFASNIIDKTGDFLYDNLVEPATDWFLDICNDVSDWWEAFLW